MRSDGKGELNWTRDGMTSHAPPPPPTNHTFLFLHVVEILHFNIVKKVPGKYKIRSH